MRILWLCGFLLASATAAQAADWQLVSAGMTSGNTVKDYVDTSTLRQGMQSTFRYRRMTKYIPPRRAGGLAYGARRTEETIDCIKRTLTMDSLVYFDDQGRPLGEMRPKALPRSIVANSTDDAIREFVCGKPFRR